MANFPWVLAKFHRVLAKQLWVLPNYAKFYQYLVAYSKNFSEISSKFIGYVEFSKILLEFWRNCLSFPEFLEFFHPWVFWLWRKKKPALGQALFLDTFAAMAATGVAGKLSFAAKTMSFWQIWSWVLKSCEFLVSDLLNKVAGKLSFLRKILSFAEKIGWVLKFFEFSSGWVFAKMFKKKSLK